MKNTTISVLAALFVFSSQASNAQASLKKWGITVAPYQAFTEKREIQLGFEKADGRSGALEVNLGFRFTGSSAPKEDPYLHETFVSSEVKQVSKGVGLLLFIPIPVTGRDKDWTDKTERRTFHTDYNAFATLQYKYYLVQAPNRSVQGGLYSTFGITAGKTGVSEYVYAEGQKGYVTELDREWVDDFEWGIGFIGTHKIVQEDIYDFTRLEIKQHHKSYLRPHLRLGYQLPIGQFLSLDLGGQATMMGFFGHKTTGQFLLVEPTARVGAWF